MDATHQEELETRLLEFGAEERKGALEELAEALEKGEIAKETGALSHSANVHFHTFYSYNISGWSPERVAWESAKAGLQVAGIVDFDVLDGLDDALYAGDLLKLPMTVSLETRVYREDYADREINSPGEPGINYFMAAGFVRRPKEKSEGEAVLERLKKNAEMRTREVARRVNSAVGLASVDYERDVLPLTPNGNATERHLLAAYEVRGKEMFLGKSERYAFWGEILGIPVKLEGGQYNPKLTDQAEFRTILRTKMMKKGGVGYVQPGAGAFPPPEDIVQLAKDSGAIPCAAWVDGTSAGEAPVDELLDKYAALGCRALALMPDRNWKAKSPEEKKIKLANLDALVKGTRRRGIALAAGTEMNNYGQPFCDDFTREELNPFAEAFRAGAWALYGHTVLERYSEMGMDSEWANRHFGTDWIAALSFYTAAGHKAVASETKSQLSSVSTPADVLSRL